MLNVLGGTESEQLGFFCLESINHVFTMLTASTVCVDYLIPNKKLVFCLEIIILLHWRLIINIFMFQKGTSPKPTLSPRGP